METRQIELSLDTAKRLYEQGGEYRDIALTAFKEYELIGDGLPKTWEEKKRIPNTQTTKRIGG